MPNESGLMRSAPLNRDIHVRPMPRRSPTSPATPLFAATPRREANQTHCLPRQAIKSDSHYTFADGTARERRVVLLRARTGPSSFEQSAGGELRLSARPRDFEIGHILYASWGQAQTDVEYFRGPSLLALRCSNYAQSPASTPAEATDNHLPLLDASIGAPSRLCVNGRSESLCIEKGAHHPTLGRSAKRGWAAYASR